MRQADLSLVAFYSRNRARFLTCLGLRMVSWMLGAVETFLILHLMGLDPTALNALLLVALPLMLDTALFFIPAGLGTMETGHTYASFILGFNPGAGLALGLLKRIRRLFWMGVGMVLLSARMSSTGVAREKLKDPFDRIPS